jgi:hypothetical protein
MSRRGALPRAAPEARQARLRILPHGGPADVSGDAQAPPSARLGKGLFHSLQVNRPGTPRAAPLKSAP